MSNLINRMCLILMIYKDMRDMERKSLIKALLEEQIEFCYTQTKDLYGISKNGITHNQGQYVPKLFIDFCRDKHGIHIVYSFDDSVYMYVKEMK